jgi:UDP-N-acetylmuramoyl-tripeptide--D-alanyl-D-alanine ligase
MRLDMQFFKTVIPEVQFLGNQIMPDLGHISLDSRQVKQGDVFVALTGARVDGHNYIHEAVTNGAIGIIINADKQSCLNKLDAATQKKICIIVVRDTYTALLALAAKWRAQFTYPVIGITGSIGKTSTKEMLAHILTQNNNKFIASKGNQNTALGISINILRMRPEHEYAILEMGVSKRGEMARMAEIAQPTIAVITSIGHCHMEGLGSLTDIANEKRDIFKFFKADNIGIIHGDMPILANISYTHPIVKFGCKTTNQVQARKVQANTASTQFMLKLYKEKHRITLDTNHIGRVINALACASVAYLLNIKPAIIIAGIQTPLSIAGRFEQTPLKAHKGVIINDAYNANPESMKAALLAFERVESKGQKIAVLGDMLELGVNSPFWHRQLGRFLRKVPSLNHVVLVGNFVKWTKSTLPVGLTCEHVPNWQAASDCLKKKLDREAVILVKGSLGMSLSNLVTELVELP